MGMIIQTSSLQPIARHGRRKLFDQSFCAVSYVVAIEEAHGSVSSTCEMLSYSSRLDLDERRQLLLPFRCCRCSRAWDRKQNRIQVRAAAPSMAAIDCQTTNRYPAIEERDQAEGNANTPELLASLSPQLSSRIKDGIPSVRKPQPAYIQSSSHSSPILSNMILSTGKSSSLTFQTPRWLLAIPPPFISVASSSKRSRCPLLPFPKVKIR